MSNFSPTLNRRLMWAIIVATAIVVPVSVAGRFRPSETMEPGDALLFLAWLAYVGALAGYGLYKLLWD